MPGWLPAFKGSLNTALPVTDVALASGFLERAALQRALQGALPDGPAACAALTAGRAPVCALSSPRTSVGALGCDKLAFPQPRDRRGVEMGFTRYMRVHGLIEHRGDPPRRPRRVRRVPRRTAP
jgi:hypothetical protein